MSIETLLQRVLNYYPECDPEFLRSAYVWADQVLYNRKASSGISYIEHALGTAMFLTRYHLEPNAIAAALLHDVLKYADESLDEIRKRFGDETANLVENSYRLSQVAWTSLEDEKATNLRKLFLIMVDDVRVVFIQLAEHLNDMHNLTFLPKNLQKQKAQEALKIFAPLATRLGIRTIKWELEDLALQNLEPKQYKQIVDLVAVRQEKREQGIRTIINTLQKKMREMNIDADIHGRPKHMYSIYKKMKKTHRKFEEIYDVQAVRIIVPEIKDCYAVLDLIHSMWQPVPEEYDDYIAVPKDNMYRSLHTAVIGPQKKALEVQIRTQQMHKTAEHGIAAHWRYKENLGRDVSLEAKIAFLRGLVDWQKNLIVSGKWVYVLTPQGDVVELTEGATPIDFAYNIHTNLGHRCRGAKVNSKLVSLDYKLQNGDRVEIIKGKKMSPSRDWLQHQKKFVRTSRARRDIRVWFQKQEWEENVSHGREVLERTLKRIGIKKKQYEKIALLFGYDELEDFLEAVGRNHVSVDQIKSKLTEKKAETSITEETLLTMTPSTILPSVSVTGMKDLMTRVAGCCNPLPGNEIIGFITRGRGVTIHRRDCHNIMRQRDSGRLLEVDWGTGVQMYSVPIQVVGGDAKKLLREMATIVEDEKAKIGASNVWTSKKDHLNIITVNVEITSVDQLHKILKRIRSLRTVAEAKRLISK